MSDKSSAYKRPPYKSRQPPAGDAAPARPNASKEKDNAGHVSYYQSHIGDDDRTYSHPATPEKPPARRVAHNHARKVSTTSTSSSSDYSYDSDTADARDIASEASSSVTRRSGTPSKGGADKRRIAIVQMDSVIAASHKSSDASPTNSIRARRGHKNDLSGLALVAPPDAAPNSYTQLTPPSTAPISGDMGRTLLAEHHDQGHHHSASEIPAASTKVYPSPSRDVGSVGTTQGPKAAMPNLASDNGRTKDEPKISDNRLYADVSQRTTRRPPSPAYSKASDHVQYSRGLLSPPTSGNSLTSASTMDSPIIVTPGIGEGKELHVPVAGPVVVNVENAQSTRAPSAASWRTDSPTPSHASGRGSTRSYTPSATSSYLRYEPGVHATAGPLPPPPRASFNIDISSPPPPRPPRLHSPTPPSGRIRGDMEAVKQALQLPPSVTAALASKSSSSSLSSSIGPRIDVEKNEETVSGNTTTEVDVVESQPPGQSVHRREAANSAEDPIVDSAPAVAEAASPSTSPATTSEESTIKDDSKDLPPSPTKVDSVDDEIPSVTVVEPPLVKSRSEPEKVDVAKFDQWLQQNPHLSDPFEQGRRSVSSERPGRESHERPLSPLSAELTGTAPSPPPKSFRNSFANNLKRFSALPRTPSLSSKSAHRRSTDSARYSSRTPSPQLHVFPPQLPLSPLPSFQKIKSTNPAALFCHEVYSQTTTMQRCVIYAGKINELYVHDCGLADWVTDMQSKGPNSGAKNQNRRVPSTQTFTSQPRQTSRSSMISEATFPTRPDATVATDLSLGAYRNITPPGIPPVLPYPSLAINPPQARNQPSRSNSSAGSGTPPSSVRSLVPTPSIKGAGFFASLGRKASLSGSKRAFPTPISAPVSAPSRSGSKSSTSSLGMPRPLNVPHSATAPSGPRAPPHRAQRSQTFTTSFSPNSSVERTREEALGRRPSLFNLALDTVVDIRADPEFSQQVDKLHALLPHADRETLAGYLRRAGQDMLAIGQYLEDERMGTIRRF